VSSILRGRFIDRIEREGGIIAAKKKRWLTDCIGEASKVILRRRMHGGGRQCQEAGAALLKILAE